MNNQEKGNWVQLPTVEFRKDLLNGAALPSPKDDLAFFSLLDRVLFLKFKDVEHYFSEVSGSEPEDLPMAGNKWFTVYDSSPLHAWRFTPTDQYNLVEVAYSGTHLYFAISAFGSRFSSALTEYVKVPYTASEFLNK